jgi:CHAD domain-containing protein
MRDHVKLQTGILLRRFAYQVAHTANSETADAIHDLRVSIRRLSNCLRVFTQSYPAHSAKRIRRRLSDLMELAGAVRDLDITLELLVQAGMPPKAALAGRLRDERRKAANRMAREIRVWKNQGFSRKWRSRLDL